MGAAATVPIVLVLVRRSESLEFLEPIEDETDFGRGDGVRGIVLDHQEPLPVVRDVVHERWAGDVEAALQNPFRPASGEAIT